MQLPWVTVCRDKDFLARLLNSVPTHHLTAELIDLLTLSQCSNFNATQNQMHGLTCVLFILTEEEQRTVLCSTLSEILESACLNKTQAFHLATLPRAKTTDSSDITDSHPEPESSQPTDTPSKKISSTHSQCCTDTEQGQVTVF